MDKNRVFSNPEAEKKLYQTPNLILYGEVSQITAAGSSGDPEGNTDGSLIDEPQDYYG